MEGIPEDFVADLRDAGSWPSLEDSLWRAPHLARATHGRLVGLVVPFLPPPGGDLLEVGCGTGHLALELARRGDRVTAIDSSPDALAVATRAAGRAPPGTLIFRLADVADWRADPAAYDAVVVVRTLHHVADPAGILERTAGWLRPGGRLVCLEFAYDRFDRRAARWVAQLRGLLGTAGLLAPEASVPADPDMAVRWVLEEWEREHAEEEHLNTLEEMLEPLEALFVREHLSWHPYLYWELLADVRPPEEGSRLGDLLAGWEDHLIRQGDIPSTLFLFVGSPAR